MQGWMCKRARKGPWCKAAHAGGSLCRGGHAGMHEEGPVCRDVCTRLHGEVLGARLHMHEVLGAGAYMEVFGAGVYVDILGAGVDVQGARGGLWCRGGCARVLGEVLDAGLHM